MCPFGKKTVYFCQCTSLSPTRGPTGFQAVIKEMTSWVSCCWALLFVLKAFICLLSQGFAPSKLIHVEAYFIHRIVVWKGGLEASALLPDPSENCSCLSLHFPLLMALLSLQTPSQLSIL